MSSTKRCFQHTAGSGEKSGSASRLSEGVVIRTLRKRVELYAFVLKKMGDFARSEHIVSVLNSRLCTVGTRDGRSKLRSESFVFLSNAGHNRNHLDFFGVESHLSSPYIFRDRRHHGLGALASGEMGKEIRIGLFDQVDPSWTTGGKHGHRTRALCETVHKFS